MDKKTIYKYFTIIPIVSLLVISLFHDFNHPFLETIFIAACAWAAEDVIDTYNNC